MSSYALLEEARTLWTEIFGEAPPDGADPEALLTGAIEGARLPDYQGFASGVLARAGVIAPRAAAITP